MVAMLPCGPTTRMLIGAKDKKLSKYRFVIGFRKSNRVEKLTSGSLISHVLVCFVETEKSLSRNIKYYTVRENEPLEMFTELMVFFLRAQENCS